MRATDACAPLGSPEVRSQEPSPQTPWIGCVRGVGSEQDVEQRGWETDPTIRMGESPKKLAGFTELGFGHGSVQQAMVGAAETDIRCHQQQVRPTGRAGGPDPLGIVTSRSATPNIACCTGPRPNPASMKPANILGRPIPSGGRGRFPDPNSSISRVHPTHLAPNPSSPEASQHQCSGGPTPRATGRPTLCAGRVDALEGRAHSSPGRASCRRSRWSGKGPVRVDLKMRQLWPRGRAGALKRPAQAPPPHRAIDPCCLPRRPRTRPGASAPTPPRPQPSPPHKSLRGGGRGTKPETTTSRS